MLAILYLALALFFGDRLRRLLLPPAREIYVSLTTRGVSDLPAWLFDLPAAAMMGLPPAMWLTYAAGYLSAKIPGLGTLANPLLPANIIAMPMLFILALAMTGRLRERAASLQLRPRPDTAPPSDPSERPADRFLRQSAGYFLVLAAFLLFGSWMMRTSLYIDDGQLHAGYSVFSDFAPHTALISSFARGANFPTWYPHFPMDGIRYHFLFYFLCGNLDFLGLPLDWAINLPSLVGLGSFCALLVLLGVLLTGRRPAYFAAPALLFLRSSFGVFTFIRDRRAEGASLVEAIRAIGQSTVFVGNTLHEDWGLYAVNVYANQRHLLFGAALLLLLLFLFLPLLRAGLRPLHPEDGRRPRLLRTDAWLPPSARMLGAALLIVIGMPYLHGSVLITFLLILAPLAVFSTGRLAHLLVAAAGIASAALQARFFAGGVNEAASFSWQFGFLADPPTLWGVLGYCIELYGAAFLLMLILPWVQPGRFRTVAAAAFLIPFGFAFFISLTPDVTVNHKYLILSAALSNILIVDLVARVWEKPRNLQRARRVDLEEGRAAGTPTLWGMPALRARLEATRIGRIALEHKSRIRSAWIVIRRGAAVLLAFLLIATGIADLWVYTQVNRNTVAMDLNSPLVTWVRENTRPDEVFLTEPLAFNDFFYSGRMVYYGHAYYAWSAGHDTAARDKQYRLLLDGCDGDYNLFRALCLEEGVSYLLVTDTMRKDKSNGYNDAFFAANFPVLARFPDKDNATVYDLR